MPSDKDKQEVIHSKIWKEEPEPDNPFAAKKYYCAGYDVYGDLLGKASWSEYLYLLFKLEKPTKQKANLLEAVAIAIANPGIRDHSVRAAMNAGVGGSTSASALMAAIAVGAGQYGGAREIFLSQTQWAICEKDLSKWEANIKNPPKSKLPDSWPELKHPVGFDPNGETCPKPVKQTLEYLSKIAGENSKLAWLKKNRKLLEEYTGMPLSMTGVIAAAFSEIGFNPEEGEMVYLFLRLPGAAVHAIEQKKLGWRKYPFFKNGLKIIDDR